PELSVSATGAGKSLIAMTTAAHTDTGLSLSVCLTIFKGQITAAIFISNTKYTSVTPKVPKWAL
ncbi:hypothetical protein P7M37_24690, partial [Vibrio parahaemolyticus]|nr:hypothetical protein [Vibrio parahaemolyticus]